MKQQVLVTLSLAAAALITGCATKQSASADRARLEAAEVTAAEERQEQAEVAAEHVNEPTEAEPLPVIEPAPEATPRRPPSSPSPRLPSPSSVPSRSPTPSPPATPSAPSPSASASARPTSWPSTPPCAAILTAS